MKKYFTTLPIIAFFLFNSLEISAQNISNNISLNADGSVAMITFKQGTSKSDLAINGKATNKSINKLLQLPEEIELRYKKSEKGVRDFSTDYYETYINGYKISGGEYRLNYKGNDVISISGKTFYSVFSGEENNTISEKTAFENALKSVNASLYSWEDEASKFSKDKNRPVGELLYLPIENNDNQTIVVLAYKFDISALKPLSRDYVYIDAATGLLLKKEAILKHNHSSGLKSLKNNINLFSAKYNTVNTELGNAATRYSGIRPIDTTLENGFFKLLDNSRGVEISTVNANYNMNFSNITEFLDADNNWTAEEFDNTEKDNAALDVHWGVTKTYDYFKDTFNRNSYDNNGSGLLSLVHYGSNYENAGWNGSYMIYGDGGSNFDILTSLDVTAHELGHAVCQETANLVYERESGGLNEGFSDIWAAIVENKYAPEKSPFLIGEDIALRNPRFMRSMSDPKQAGDPDTYKGQNWVTANVDEGCTIPIREANDYCGVHTNSGVLNHWFYILVMGKSGVNDKGNSYNVSGIGWTDAEQIVYRLESSYLTSYSSFKNARDFGIQAAIDLFGANSAQAIATQNAFYAVGIGGQYLSTADTTPPSTPANLIASETTGNATTLTWDAATDANGIWGYYIYKDGVEVARTSNLTYRIDGLSINSNYNFTVKAYDNYNNLSSESNTVNVNTTALRAPCVSASGTASLFSIKNVKLNTINNTSSLITGYEDFAYITTELSKGQTYELTIEPQVAAAYRTRPLNYDIYLDYNNTGYFNASKKIASISQRTGIVSTTITLPDNVQLNNPVRLRIVQIYAINGQTSNGCNSFFYGQVEDYGVIARPSLATSDLDVNQMKIYPNPVKDILNVELAKNSSFDYEIINTLGSVVAKGSSFQKIDVNSLNSGVYILKIKQEDVEITQKFIKK